MGNVGGLGGQLSSLMNQNSGFGGYGGGMADSLRQMNSYAGSGGFGGMQSYAGQQSTGGSAVQDTALAPLSNGQFGPPPTGALGNMYAKSGLQPNYDMMGGTPEQLSGQIGGNPYVKSLPSPYVDQPVRSNQDDLRRQAEAQFYGLQGQRSSLGGQTGVSQDANGRLPGDPMYGQNTGGGTFYQDANGNMPGNPAYDASTAGRTGGGGEMGTMPVNPALRGARRAMQGQLQPSTQPIDPRNYQNSMVGQGQPPQSSSTAAFGGLAQPPVAKPTPMRNAGGMASMQSGLGNRSPWQL